MQSSATLHDVIRTAITTCGLSCLLSAGACGPLMPDAENSTSTAAETSEGRPGSTSVASAGATSSPWTSTTSAADGTNDDDTNDDDTNDGGTPDEKFDISPACLTSDDCVLIDSCCDCSAEPASRVPPDRCDVDCAEGRCSALGIDAAVCNGGHCESSRDCDATEVQCAAPPPVCPAGMLPSVLDGCWGSCLPAATCRVVASCRDCPADHVCVPVVSYGVVRCAEVLPDCPDDPPSCDCIDPQTCLDFVAVNCFDTEEGPACEPVGGDPPG